MRHCLLDLGRHRSPGGVQAAHRAMLATCERHTFAGDRDRAVLLALLDTGCRATRFLALDIQDVNMANGAVINPRRQIRELSHRAHGRVYQAGSVAPSAAQNGGRCTIVGDDGGHAAHLLEPPGRHEGVFRGCRHVCIACSQSPAGRRSRPRYRARRSSAEMRDSLACWTAGSKRQQ